MKSNSYLIVSLIACTLIMTGLQSMPSWAADDKGLYQSLNYVSCLQYKDDRKLPAHTGRRAGDEIYISGWLSAYNLLTPDTYDIVPGHDLNKVLEWLDTYCRTNPNQNIEAGLLQFTSESYPARIQYYPSPTHK